MQGKPVDLAQKSSAAVTKDKTTLLEEEKVQGQSMTAVDAGSAYLWA